MLKSSLCLLITITGLCLVCCLCSLLGLGGTVTLFTTQTDGEELLSLFPPATQTPQLVRPVSVSGSTFEVLKTASLPESNLIELARRLEGISSIPLTLPSPASPIQIGAEQSFWISNEDTGDTFQVEAVLRYATDHLYFWIEKDVPFHEREVSELAWAFGNHIYPTTRAFFGHEWNPGVDNDPHLYVLYARGLGDSVAGYFSSIDEYLPLAHEYSNAHEMFFLNADVVELDETYTLGLLAHEFQHMIQWYQDKNETAWLNEGFSEVAALINGYYDGGFDYLYTRDTDLQLNDWPQEAELSAPHYGAAFLFVTYFLDRFGKDAIQALVAHPQNGLDSVDAVLAELGIKDPQTGSILTADDVFMDWAVANYLQDASVADGRYAYSSYPEASQANITETIRRCPMASVGRDVHQWGVDYIRITCKGDFTLQFEGSLAVSVLPTDFHSGEYAFWSNRGDEADTTLTRTFDFSNHQGELTLSFWTWYDLEEGYDYLYLTASLDGEHWEILTTPSGTAEDPSGNSYGWAYNGISGGMGEEPVWIHESVDISQYAGQLVDIRFEYVTDGAILGEGFLLDDVAIPEMNYFTDFETDSGGWEADGFVRITNELPQTFALQLVSFGEDISVQHVPVPADNLVEIPVHIGGEVNEVLLIVSGTTRYTRQLAVYRYSIIPSP
ncbi:MAG: hypothetical protein AB1345_13495 [Chloroflexota bacterium]